MVLAFKPTLYKSKKSVKIREQLSRQTRVVVPVEEAEGYRWHKKKDWVLLRRKNA